MVGILTSGGIGDQILAFQAASFVAESGNDVRVFCAARDEVYKPLTLLFNDLFVMRQVPENTGDLIVSNQIDLKSITNIDESYIIWPDLMFRHPKIFPCKKFNTNPALVRGKRLLTRLAKPSRTIYFGLNTSTREYLYPQAALLIKSVASRLPEYNCYTNNIENWAGHNVSFVGSFENLDNIIIDSNSPFEKALEMLSKSSYCVCLDNGISHIAYQYGIPRLLLDVRLNQDGIKWIARWRENTDESVDSRADIDLLSRVVATNLRVNQTQLISRSIVAANIDANWKEVLLLKY